MIVENGRYKQIVNKCTRNRATITDWRYISTDMLLYLKPQTIFGSVSRVQQNRDCLPQQFTAWGFFIRLWQEITIWRWNINAVWIQFRIIYFQRRCIKQVQTTARMFRYKHIAECCSFLSGIKNKKLINNDFSHIQHQVIATNDNPSSLLSIFSFDHAIPQIHPCALACKVHHHATNCCSFNRTFSLFMCTPIRYVKRYLMHWAKVNEISNAERAIKRVNTLTKKRNE